MANQRLLKLLELAGRSTSNENERLVALGKVAAQLEANGLGWADLPTLLGVDASRLRSPTPRADPQLQARVDELERLLHEARLSHDLLARENRQLRDAKPPKPQVREVVKEVVREVVKEVPVEVVKWRDRTREVRSDTVSWPIFAKLASNILGSGWRDQASRFGASAAMLKRWEGEGHVPTTFLDKLARARRFDVEKRPVERKRVDKRI